jgi:hypothetical protein
MTAVLQITPNLSVAPLINMRNADFARLYACGLRWCLFGGREGDGPLDEQYLFKCVKRCAEVSYFDGQREQELCWIGFYLGMIHGGVLSPDGTPRQDVTTLVRLHSQNCTSGYQAGREWFFRIANINERALSDDEITEQLQELVMNTPSYDDKDGVWHFTLGCLLGELSGPLFSWRPQEQHLWEEKCRTLPCLKDIEVRSTESPAVSQLQFQESW